MSKFTTLSELAAGLNKCTHSTRFKAWEKNDKKRIYIHGVGYNTKKMSTKAWIEVGGDHPYIRVDIECPSQPQSWIDSQEQKIMEQYAAEIRYCRRYFNFELATQPIDVILNNSILAAETVIGYYTKWEVVRVKINSFGKLAARNRQFVVPFEGTKDSAPYTFAPLNEKAFVWLKQSGEQMLDAYETVPDYNELVIRLEEFQIAEKERKETLLREEEAKKDAQIQQTTEKYEKLLDLEAAGMPILIAWKTAGCPHPAPAEVCEAKKASGLNWNNFTASIQ